MFGDPSTIEEQTRSALSGNMELGPTAICGIGLGPSSILALQVELLGDQECSIRKYGLRLGGRRAAAAATC